MNKICVYAICKNEIKFVDKWIDNMSEADYIVVLDTGSTDGTYEKLKSDKRITLVKQKEIKPWRFEVARNESMKLVPDDANILVCTDFDELFVPGWANVLRNNWIEGKHKQAHYKYSWDHEENGDPRNIFIYDKITDRNTFKWKFPIHEILMSDTTLSTDEILTLDDRVYLHHYQDMSKDRTSTIKLLELRLEESKDFCLSWYLLAREYGIIGKYYDIANSTKWFMKSIDTFKEALNQKCVQDDHMTYVGCLCILGDLYVTIGDYRLAIDTYNRLIEYDKTYRQPYLGIAEIYNKLGLYNSAVGLVFDGVQNSYQHFDWTETGNVFTDKMYDILSVAYYYIGKYKDGIKMAEKALSFCPTNERILKNYKALQTAAEKEKYKM